MAQADPIAPVKTSYDAPSVADIDDDLHDDDEPTTEELIDMLRESLRDVEEGRTRPAREVMAEIREMLSADADAN